MGGIVLIGIIDIVELFRRVGDKEGVGFLTVLVMQGVKTPSTIPFLLPFSALFGAMYSFYSLRSQNEIVIARTSGLSLIKLMMPAIFFAFIYGVFALLVIDPVSSATNQRYDTMEKEILGSGGRNLTVSTEGIWFRDQNSSYATIIHGSAIDNSAAEVLNPVIYTFDNNDRIINRYYPDRMLLKEGYWEIEGGITLGQAGRVSELDRDQIETTLTRRDLNRSNKRPETIALFSLWNYISVLERTGLPSLGYEAYLYSKLALPFVLIGMVMIAGRFTLPLTGRRKVTHLLVFSICLGVLFYFLNDFLYVMGSSGRLPPPIAGFAPGVTMTVLGAGLLIRADEI
jgi:lipopolysaccharide export system permease protein